MSIPPWDGKDRLNILLIGADQRPGEGTFNTDTLIVVLDRPGHQAGRDVQPAARHGDVPIPPGPARNVFGSVYPGKINAWWTNIHRRTDLYPGSVQNGTVGYNGLKAIMGYLYGLDIKYFVEVNFDGFKNVVDAMGGRDGQRPDPRLGRSLPVDRRRPPPGLHPERHPAHEWRRGPPLRPLAPRLE